MRKYCSLHELHLQYEYNDSKSFFVSYEVKATRRFYARKNFYKS